MFSAKSILNRETECYILFDLILVVSLVTESSVWKKKLDVTEIHFRSDKDDLYAQRGRQGTLSPSVDTPFLCHQSFTMLISGL